MSFLRITLIVLATAGALSGQSRAANAPAAQLPAHATLPIAFTKTINAAKVKAGDPVVAKTTQSVRLADGSIVPPGALVTGHVLAAKVFTYDKTPYAKQNAGTLDIQFDALYVQGAPVPLSVSLRAMADPVTSWGAYEPLPNDPHSFAATSQVGGDILDPAVKEILNPDGDVVGYNKKAGPFAHLIANTRGSLTCDAGDTEQPVSRFSASACGLYGFVGVSVTVSTDSHITLSSTHRTPQIVKHSTALLETQPDGATRR